MIQTRESLARAPMDSLVIIAKVTLHFSFCFLKVANSLYSRNHVIRKKKINSKSSNLNRTVSSHIQISSFWSRVQT